MIAVAFGSWWPTFGFFVPKKDLWRDTEFLKYNGLQAFATWMSLVLISAGASILYSALYASGLGIFLKLIIIYQAIPFFPFDGMDGAKVLGYNKLLYAIGLVICVFAIIFF